MLLWTSEAVQSDQAFSSFTILFPPCSQKWHGYKVGALTSYYLLNGTLPVVRYYIAVSSIHCLHLCVSLTVFLLSLSPILSHPPSLSALPSEFSEVVDLFTSCSVPLPPFPPELEMAGVTWLCLKWQRPASSPKEDDIFYILEMEEEGSVCLLRKPKIIMWDCSSCMKQQYMQTLFSVKYYVFPIHVKCLPLMHTGFS